MFLIKKKIAVKLKAITCQEKQIEIGDKDDKE